MNRIDEELIEAAKANNLPEVRRLLSVGADIEVEDNDSYMPLYWASMKGHALVVKELLDHGADTEATTRFGNTSLHFACTNGHEAVVNELLSRGANTEAKNNAGNTPLHFASLDDHLAIVKALLAVGADILATNNNGDHPIHLAVCWRKSEVAKSLLQHFYATIIRRLPIHGLLKDLTWIGNPTISGAPPLRYALHHNVLGTDDVVEILEFLVNQNSELLNSRDQDGSLPLHVACRRGASFAIVQSLMDLYKASVKSVTPRGDFPLFLACEVPEPSLDTIFLLMKLYPDLVYR
jgi:ankyrin repeat protein